MQLNPLLKFLSHFLLWLIPAFLLWWISANSIIVPSIRVVVAKTANIWFYKEQVQLHGDRWFIRTNLIAKPLPQDRNQHRRWTIFFQPVLIYTIGFPLLWAWFLASVAWGRVGSSTAYTHHSPKTHVLSKILKAVVST